MLEIPPNVVVAAQESYDAQGMRKAVSRALEMMSAPFSVEKVLTYQMVEAAQEGYDGAGSEPMTHAIARVLEILGVQGEEPPPPLPPGPPRAERVPPERVHTAGEALGEDLLTEYAVPCLDKPGCRTVFKDLAQAEASAARDGHDVIESRYVTPWRPF